MASNNFRETPNFIDDDDSHSTISDAPYVPDLSKKFAWKILTLKAGWIGDTKDPAKHSEPSSFCETKMMCPRMCTISWITFAFAINVTSRTWKWKIQHFLRNSLGNVRRQVAICQTFAWFNMKYFPLTFRIYTTR